jgi:ribose/xylose/arabinose/galactoside ABC-type transport system permease subunit
MLAIARLIRIVTTLVVLLIALGILLWVLSANQHNSVVSDIHDAANWLVTPFHGLFSIKGSKLHLAVNWGVAAVVYAIVGGFLASIAARVGIPRRSFGRVRPVA